MINSIFQIEDDVLCEAVFEAYSALFEVGALPQLRELKEDEKPSFNTFRYIDNTPDKKTVRVYTYNANKKPYVMLVQARLSPPMFAKLFGVNRVATVNFNKDNSPDFNATGTGGITAFNAAFGMMKQLLEEMNVDAVSFVPSGGDATEKETKSRLYNSYFSKFAPEFKPLPKDQIPPQQAAMGMEVRVRR